MINEDEFNLSIRKFLKKVGITSQREIEQAVRKAVDSGQLDALDELDIEATLQLQPLDTQISIQGKIRIR